MGEMQSVAGALIFDQWGSYDRAFMLMLGLSIIAMVLPPFLQGKSRAQAESGA